MGQNLLNYLTPFVVANIGLFSRSHPSEATDVKQ